MIEKIAVFIDGDNINSSDIEVILNEIKNYGRIISCKVYADWGYNMKKWRANATKFGIETIQCDRISKKNSTDIKMVVDIMKMLYTVKHLTLFYIVTSDSDYRHLFPEIKLVNKKIHCIGSENSNLSIQSMCDVYTKIEVLNKVSNQNNFEIVKEKYWNEILGLFDGNNEINLSNVKDVLQRKYQFDNRAYMSNSMSDFIQKYYSDRLILTKYNTNDKKGCYVTMK